MSLCLACIRCTLTYPTDQVRYECDCGNLLEVRHDPKILAGLTWEKFRARKLSPLTIDISGVWRFREALSSIPDHAIVTHPEGATRTYQRASLATYCGVQQVTFKHEGENPTGSFKDRGMTVAVSQAKHLGMKAVGCASTGNTSASLAAYAAHAGLRSVVFLPAGRVSSGKLAQSLGYGATCLAVRGDFDAAMRLVREASDAMGLYLVNSLNPFRLEGQKTIIWELLLDRVGKVPDWIVVPAGNLGNTSAFGKALREALAAGWIDRMPRLAAIQAQGANPFYQSFATNFSQRFTINAETLATAIRIGDPVNFEKAKDVISLTNGLVAQVSDSEIMAAKKAIDRSGIGCEPASAATLAGIKALRAAGTIKESDDVVAILTGHMLKDTDAVLAASDAKVIEIDPTLRSVEQALNTTR